MGWLPLDAHKRLEAFFEMCPNYGHTWVEWFAVGCSWNTMFLYGFMLLHTYYTDTRTVLLFVLYTTLGVESACTYAINWFVPQNIVGRAACSQEDGVVSADASVLTTVTVFLMLLKISHGSKSSARVGLLFLVVFLLNAASIFSMLVLELFSVAQIISGILTGIFWGLVANLIILHFVEPNQDNENSTTGKVMRFLDLRPSSILSNGGRSRHHGKSRNK